MKRTSTNLIAEFGPFPGHFRIHGVTFDGERVWFATDPSLEAIDPETGQIVRSLPVKCTAGSAFDGQNLYLIVGSEIQKVDPVTAEVLHTIPLPPGTGCSGMSWAEGSLWVGQYHDRRIQRIDPDTGAVQRTIDTDRFVTGVTWLNGNLWHATWENGDSELRRIDATTGESLEVVELPEGINVSGLESNGVDRFYCGGESSGRIRVVQAP